MGMGLLFFGFWFLVFRVEMAGLFKEERPFASSAVLACVVYSLVPFVGVVFVPFIFVFGVVGLVRGDRSVFNAISAGVPILIAQVVLWWLLYAVPQWRLVGP